ncbi:GntR family transcriptional regulator [Paenibacillus hodogayensis]|uniref:GntR family transcriptional regulator n=1 Tax=Paenibacillus hodogayensis TaxID=279208 RepID=A0ABV5VXT5_9BACL
MPLDKNSPVPLYHQLTEALVKMIEDHYVEGDALPTEPELEQRFGVSRMTVRLAMNALADEGLVERKQGRGTFVRSPKITHQLTSITSWTEQMKERGFVPHTVHAEIVVVDPPKKIGALLQLRPGERTVRIKRVRYASGEPMCIMINYVKETLLGGFAEKGLQGESFYETLARDYGIRIAKAQETVEAREATEHEAELLRIQAWSPVLFVTRLSYLPDSVPFEVVHLTSRADRYRYQIMLYAGDAATR